MNKAIKALVKNISADAKYTLLQQNTTVEVVLPSLGYLEEDCPFCPLNYQLDENLLNALNNCQIDYELHLVAYPHRTRAGGFEVDCCCVFYVNNEDLLRLKLAYSPG